jgi:hypothetical protein
MAVFTMKTSFVFKSVEEMFRSDLTFVERCEPRTTIEAENAILNDSSKVDVQISCTKGESAWHVQTRRPVEYIGNACSWVQCAE